MKFNKARMIIVLLVSIGGAALASPIIIDVYKIKKAENMIKSRMKDPSSAQFRNIKIKSDSLVDEVCGEVNGRNSMGGYVGFSLFIVTMYKDGDKEPFVQWQSQYQESDSSEAFKNRAAKCP